MPLDRMLSLDVQDVQNRAAVGVFFHNYQMVCMGNQFGCMRDDPATAPRVIGIGQDVTCSSMCSQRSAPAGALPLAAMYASIAFKSFRYVVLRMTRFMRQRVAALW